MNRWYLYIWRCSRSVLIFSGLTGAQRDSGYREFLFAIQQVSRVHETPSIRNENRATNKQELIYLHSVFYTLVGSPLPTQISILIGFEFSQACWCQPH